MAKPKLRKEAGPAKPQKLFMMQIAVDSDGVVLGVANDGSVWEYRDQQNVWHALNMEREPEKEAQPDDAHKIRVD